jgi:DNA-binding CsgD family transcriptional regulator
MSLSDTEELVGNFAELIFAERDLSIIWPAMLRRIESAVGFDAGYIAASFGASTDGRGAVLEHNEPFLKRNLGRFLIEISPGEIARYTDRAARHPEVWSPARQRELAVFREVLWPTGMQEMAVRVSVRQGNVAGFNLERRGRASPFSEGGLSLIDAVAPFLHIVELLTLESDDEQNASNLAAEHALSTREAELVSLVARGLQNAEVALLLGISPNTVRNTLARVFEKVGVSTRAELTYHATRLGRDRGSAPSGVDDGTAVFKRRVQEVTATKLAPESGARVRSSGQIVYTPPLARSV